MRSNHFLLRLVSVIFTVCLLLVCVDHNLFSFADASITINGNWWRVLTAGNTHQLYVTISPSSLHITWSSSDPLVASVDSEGLVTANNFGMTFITASAVYNGQTIVSDPLYVYVKTVPDGEYFIQNGISNKFMELESASANNGIPIQQGDFDETNKQRWYISFHYTTTSCYYKIKSVYSNRYVHLANTTGQIGTPIVQSSTAGHFGIYKNSSYDYYYIVPSQFDSSKKCLTVPTSGLNIDGQDVLLGQHTSDSSLEDEWILSNTSDYIGYFPTWNSTGNRIAAVPSNLRTYYKANEMSPANPYYDTAVSYAVSQWNTALNITLVVGEYSGPTFRIHDVTPEEYHNLTNYDWSYVNDNPVLGITWPSNNFVGYGFNAANTKISVYSQIGGNAYIYHDINSSNLMKCVVTHELGHLLGYLDHSPSNTDVMFHSCANSIYILTVAEKQHLLNAYNLLPF